MFELTDTLTYAVPVMLSILTAKTIADWLEPQWIYDLVIESVSHSYVPSINTDLSCSLSQLPYLDAKHEYQWGNLLASDMVQLSTFLPRKMTYYELQTDRFVEVVRLDEQNTVKRLRDKLRDALSAGYADSGFPILYRDSRGLRVAGYIGMNELEHALGMFSDL